MVEKWQPARRGLTESTKITVSAGVAWTLLLALVAGTWLVAMKLSAIEMQIANAKSFHMSKAEMQIWVKEAGTMNPTLRLPPAPQPEPPQSKNNGSMAVAVLAESRIETRKE